MNVFASRSANVAAERFALSRWKRTASVERRTGPPLEFGIHRAAAILTMLTEALSTVETRREER